MVEFFDSANILTYIIRSFFALLDKVVYLILGFIYQLLFSVASADWLSNDIIQKFYSRMQLIIGIFMIFKLAIVIVKGIINPDTFTDKKSGFSNIIVRIITSLVLLTALTPMNISGAGNEYEQKISTNGLLFGTLYSLQERILKNNTIGRLVLGTSDDLSDPINGNSSDMSKMSNLFTTTILRGFVRINLKSEDGDENNQSDWACESVDADVMKAYKSSDATPNQILSLTAASCEAQGGGFFEILSKLKFLAGDDVYVFSYMPIVSTIVGAILIYILVFEAITIAMRTIKLAILRLIAPIPVISYIDPNGAKDGAFPSWVKALTSTYLELFLHLAVIYFVLFLVQEILFNFDDMNFGSGILGMFTFIVIIIALFFFMKEAPKFILSALGIKSTGNNLGLNMAFGGAAAALGGGGLVGFTNGVLSSANDTSTAASQGKTMGMGDAWNKQSDLMAKIRTGDKDARGGMMGSALDYLNYGTRERQAVRLGVGKNQVAALKYESDRLAKDAEALKTIADNAKLNMDRIFSNAGATDAEKQAAQDAYTAALTNYDAANSKANKAKSTYDKFDKSRGQLGTSPRVYDLYNNTYRTPTTVVTGEGADKDYAIDVDGNRITEPLQSAEARAQYRFKRDNKNFEGRVDDDGFGTSGHGGGGGPRGGPRP